MTRILLIARWPVGGIRTYLRYFYNQLDIDRFTLSLIAPEGEETEALLADLNRFSLNYIRCKETIAPTKFFRLIQRNLSNEYELVHSHGFTSGLLASVPARMKGIPHIMTCHEPLNQVQFKRIKGVLLESSFFLCMLSLQCINFVSNDAMANFLKLIPTSSLFKRKMVVINNGIETSRFLGSDRRDFRKELNLPQDTFLVGYFGRFMPEKGFRFLVEATHILCKDGEVPKKPIVVALGMGGFIREEIRKIHKMRIEANFRFLPYTQDVAASMKGLDVLAMPSLWEAFGLLAAEALVAGVPVIGTSCAGLREVLQSTPARIVPPAESFALAKAIKEEMLHPTKEETLAFQKEAAVRFDVKDRAMELKQIFNKFIRY